MTSSKYDYFVINSRIVTNCILNENYAIQMDHGSNKCTLTKHMSYFRKQKEAIYIPYRCGKVYVELKVMS